MDRPQRPCCSRLPSLPCRTPRPNAETPQGTNAATSSEDFALNASLKTHLAYVVTGDPQIDETSREGLSGLSKVLTARTALEPGEPIGVDVDTDDLSFFPILYWPVPEDAKPLSDATLAKVDAFMKQGGMIIFDTRDQENPLGGGLQSQGLTRLIGQLDIPPLEPVPANHVLTKSFYLMRTFPGRWDGGTTWVEAEPTDEAERSERSRRTDGVSSIVVTSNDLASAWALDSANRPIYPVVPGGEVQREMAFRAGVNMVMYALTGNYKADQVHLPGPARTPRSMNAMNWSIEFNPFVSWPVLWALAALGVLLFGILLWRSRRGALLRAVSYALVLLAIANPQLKEEDREPLNDVVAVVVDDSQSQAIAGRIDSHRGDPQRA